MQFTPPVNTAWAASMSWSEFLARKMATMRPFNKACKLFIMMKVAFPDI
jgi:hypothetical protein